MNTRRLSIMFLLGAAFLLPAPTHAQFDALGFGKDGGDAKIAYFKLKGPMPESPPPASPFLFLDMDTPSSLQELVARLKQARRDNSVKAIVVDLQSAQMGFGQLKEIRDALASFSAVDKDVYVHADTLRTGTYALATGASHVSIVPHGGLWLLGLHGETPYIKGLLDKTGLVPDIEHCGDFKSAHEIFTRTGPSKEAQEMTDWLLDSLYGSLVDMIADGRDLSADKVRRIIDDGPYTAEEALELGLIDSVQHRQDFVASIKKRYGSSVKVVSDYGKKNALEMSDNPFQAFAQLFKLLNPMPKTYTTPSVAIVFVEGAIVPGEAEQSPFGGSSGAFSTTIRKALDKAAADKSVKAVVLRVDSPGGSALASEIIWDATQRVLRKKPLIVSMGNVAASGGYYVSCGADTIFADNTTITASIGVLGGKIVTTNGWEKLGITWSGTRRGRMAAMMSTAAPFDDKERESIVRYMNHVYGVFKKRVTDGRGAKLTKPIDKMAGGRVYTGAQALDLGLVDKIGGLSDAIKFAAKQASLVDPEIRIIPEPPTIFDMFSPKKGDDFASIRGTAVRPAGRGSILDNPIIGALMPAVASIDPLRASAIRRSLICLDLLHRDGAVMMMPGQLVVH